LTLALHALGVEKLCEKACHDRNQHDKKLIDRDLVLLFRSKKHKSKLKLIGDGLYIIYHIYMTDAVMLQDLEGNYFLDLINGSQIKKYNCIIEEALESVVPPC